MNMEHLEQFKNKVNAQVNRVEVRQHAREPRWQAERPRHHEIAYTGRTQEKGERPKDGKRDGSRALR